MKLKISMRILVGLLLVVSFVSCNRDEKKENKEWTDKAGKYSRSVAYTIYEDADWLLVFDQVNVDGSGISLVSKTVKQMPSINFDVLKKEHNKNSKFEYKLRFSSLLSLIVSEDGTVSNPQIDHGLFVGNREFYISFKGNVLTFTILDQGKVINLDFTKN